MSTKIIAANFFCGDKLYNGSLISNSRQITTSGARHKVASFALGLSEKLALRSLNGIIL